MKKIKLYRPIENFNKNCSYEILVNGKKMTDLKNGEEKVIGISNELGKLNLRAKIQWCGSEKLLISESNNIEVIKVTGNKFLNRQMPFAGGLFPLTGIVIFSGNSELFKNIGIGILILLLLGLIGTLTIWKSRWLKVIRE
ncbi:hypothetical protein PbJCM13498_31670 [Prolixibacter bellariivorans]|uniref:Uncharacterized protein n=1 Tax=Prolixibacter bellariivorans TaxID=314319 RepID=A0A5M4B2J9_9BACT|nr:hypothetical protein [Prolixibacter bellariivorans]GET34304.1 hypothetical protein PbJCM13498_31670 [Prolixibacter bellariivorans]